MNDNRSATSHEFEYTPETCPCTPTYGDCAACGGDHSARPTYPVNMLTNRRATDPRRTSTHIDMRLSRSEHYSARTARLNAVIRESDRELREAVRGTWIEAELGGQEEQS